MDVIRVKEVKFRPRMPIGWKHTDRSFHEIQYRMSKLERMASKDSQVLEIDDGEDEEKDNDSVVRSGLDDLSDLDSEDEDLKGSSNSGSRKVGNFIDFVSQQAKECKEFSVCSS